MRVVAGAGRQDLRPVAESRSSKTVRVSPDKGRGTELPWRASSVLRTFADDKAVSVNVSRPKLGFFSEQRQKPTNVFDAEQTEVSRLSVTEVTSAAAWGWPSIAMSSRATSTSSSRTIFDERIDESSIPAGFALARPSVEKARNGARAPHARNLEAGWGGGLRVGGSRPPAEGPETCRGAVRPRRADVSRALAPSGGQWKVCGAVAYRTLQSAKSMPKLPTNSRVRVCRADIGGAQQ